MERERSTPVRKVAKITVASVALSLATGAIAGTDSGTDAITRSIMKNCDVGPGMVRAERDAQNRITVRYSPTLSEEQARCVRAYIRSL
jgi:hypothetical protein